jgi:hypothetical protein
MSHITKTLKQFDKEFTHHPHGVFNDGKIEFPEYRPLTKENIKRFLLTSHLSYLEEVESLIAKEMLICHQEGTPTSRLTSLASQIRQEKVETEQLLKEL